MRELLLLNRTWEKEKGCDPIQANLLVSFALGVKTFLLGARKGDPRSSEELKRKKGIWQLGVDIYVGNS